MAATDELTVGRGRAEQIAGRALARVEARPHRRARLVAAIVSGSAFAIVSVTGVGAIADQAVPGDSLYAVDRAYESISRVIGRDADRTQERIEEAIALVQRGDRVAAANHVNTELGRRIPVIELPDTGIAENPVETTLVNPDVGPDAGVATASIDAVPTTTPDVGSAPADEVPAVEAESDGDDGDPFLLALENALRATQAAAGTDDELIAAEADAAVRSVVKLAAGTSEEDSGAIAEQVAPGALSVAETTTTTTTRVRGNGQTAPGNNTSTTTTTSVPDDSEEVPPGDGETAGDDSGGSQEGSGSAGEPGDAGDESPGPVILPIP